jgi:hypothetical protein
LQCIQVRANHFSMLGSLADGALLSPEARLRDGKNSNPLHRRLPCCDCALGGLVRSALCAPKSPSCRGTCANRRIVGGSTPPCVSKTTFGPTAATEPGLTKRGILTIGSNSNPSNFIEAVMNNHERAGHHHSSSPPYHSPYIFCRQCQLEEFCSGNCCLHCHHGPHMYNIQSRAILKGDSNA